MKRMFWGNWFEELRTVYLATYKTLLGVKDAGKRRKILDDWCYYEQWVFE